MAATTTPKVLPILIGAAVTMSLAMGILLFRMTPALGSRALHWTRLRPSDTL